MVQYQWVRCVPSGHAIGSTMHPTDGSQLSQLGERAKPNTDLACLSFKEVCKEHFEGD